VLAALLLGLLVTGAGMVVMALGRSIGTVAAFWRGLTALVPELVTSGIAAQVAAAVLVALGLGLAGVLRQGGALSSPQRGIRRVARFALLMVVALLLATPAPVLGISLKELMNRPGWAGAVHDSPAILLLGYGLRFLPFAVLLLQPAVQRVSREHEDAARLDGCDWLALQRHIYWPAARRDVLVAWLLLVILCIGEVSTTVLLAPPGWPTLAVRAFTLLHSGVYADVATLAIASMALIVAPWGALLLVIRRRRI
jgi:iron(III) transport system permease protein